MQAVRSLKDKNFKSALTSIGKARQWPENLGAGKPYDDMIDLRLEKYLEGLSYEGLKQKEKAHEKFTEVASISQRSGNQILDLITAMALKKTGRAPEGDSLLKDWIRKQPGNKSATWSYAVFQGQNPGTEIDTNDNERVIKELFAQR